VAFHQHWDEFEASVLPTTSSSMESKVIMTSTPNGMNHFWTYWDGATKGTNGYNPIMVRWKDVPGRNNKWMEETLASMSHNQQKFDAEYNVEFLGSSGTLIAGYKLKELLSRAENPIYSSNNLAKFHEPEQTSKYVICCDVSEGKGLDYSTMQVIDCTVLPYRQVCVYRSNNVAPADFAQIIYQTALSYNHALVLIEYSSVGPLISNLLYDGYEYEGLLHTESGGPFGRKISHKAGQQIEAGLRINQTIRRQACSMLKLLIEQDKLICRDMQTINEFTTFSRKSESAKWQAEEGCNDDLISGLLIFSWLVTQDYFKECTDVNTISALRDQTQLELEEQMLLPAGFNTRVETFDDRKEPLMPPVDHRVRLDRATNNWLTDDEKEWMPNF